MIMRPEDPFPKYLVPGELEIVQSVLENLTLLKISQYMLSLGS